MSEPGTEPVSQVSEREVQGQEYEQVETAVGHGIEQVCYICTH